LRWKSKEGATMQFVRLLLLVSAISSVWAGPASAMTCRDWNRLADGQKASAIEGMIQDAIASQRGRSYGVNRGAIGRCLDGSARDIQYAFDDACANSRTTSMQALNNIFKRYIWSCVG